MMERLGSQNKQILDMDIDELTEYLSLSSPKATETETNASAKIYSREELTRVRDAFTEQQWSQDYLWQQCAQHWPVNVFPFEHDPELRCPYSQKLHILREREADDCRWFAVGHHPPNGKGKGGDIGYGERDALQQTRAVETMTNEQIQEHFSSVWKKSAAQRRGEQGEGGRGSTRKRGGDHTQERQWSIGTNECVEEEGSSREDSNDGHLQHHMDAWPTCVTNKNSQQLEEEKPEQVIVGDLLGLSMEPPQPSTNVDLEAHFGLSIEAEETSFYIKEKNTASVDFAPRQSVNTNTKTKSKNEEEKSVTMESDCVPNGVVVAVGNWKGEGFRYFIRPNTASTENKGRQPRKCSFGAAPRQLPFQPKQQVPNPDNTSSSSITTTYTSASKTLKSSDSLLVNSAVGENGGRENDGSMSSSSSASTSDYLPNPLQPTAANNNYGDSQNWIQMLVVMERIEGKLDKLLKTNANKKMKKKEKEKGTALLAVN